MTASNREARLLDRVRETAKRCIDLGVRIDVPGYTPDNVNAWAAYHDYKSACDDALFQLAEVAGWGEMYTKEDVDSAYNRGFDSASASAAQWMD